MKKSFRIICLVLAIAFAASMLISIVCSIALADGMDTRGETVYVETDAEGNVLSMISSVYIRQRARWLIWKRSALTRIFQDM